MITVYHGKGIYSITPNENDHYIPEGKMDIDDRLKLFTDIIESKSDAVIYTNCDFLLRHINLHYMATKENHLFYVLDDRSGVPLKSKSGEDYYDKELQYVLSTYPEYQNKLLRENIQVFEINDDGTKKLMADSNGFTIDYFDEHINKQNELLSRLNWEWMVEIT